MHYETTTHNHSTGPFNVRFLPPKVLLFYRALRRCLGHRFSISLVSLPYREEKNKNKRGRNKPTRQRHEISSHLYSNFHQMDSHSQNIPPHLPHRCQEVAAFGLPTSGRNLASCRYAKPLPPSAVKVSTVIRNQGQPRAEACLESV